MQTSRVIDTSAKRTDKETGDTTTGKGIIDHGTSSGDLCRNLHAMAKGTNKERKKGQQFFTGFNRKVLCLKKHKVKDQEILQLLVVGHFFFHVDIHVSIKVEF
ncbi:hypothetical protein G6F62_015825 [Rhizopus arrhizus]|nr:hypothetical protein G6F62_015825 [Rhizopus arrhizus]